ncbi:hypothetical protein FNF27_08067 [Cafeteria roenbergensis]|uniref:Uncharacterized protein n=1 Tax=Cafeteria roenbergensis TaxID=33653 RepID=A0A5A8DUN6_CAFRO|nr:hypothetical protein FNF31_06829 [Cafeteria roenbergensis]KAA0156856.1 hypothetical protein FNF29_00966 [Cafeteria roenbergensis]KAA0162358.1 hypothetical protein FNF27_08067 [Cafeteria roenbergensis]KAA0167550.1 hypothetical protein FNF28_02764 [Cafeteria roenbergensis]|eukprot:KAA0156856.1 hypothetical protein FNF29_00966 [Cafeteria roenbergensis]
MADRKPKISARGSSTASPSAAATATPTVAPEADEAPAFYAKYGQRMPTPSPGSGDRVFYESLYKENPASNMAVVWMVEHGVFSKDVAQAMAPRYEEAKLAMKAMSVPTVAPTGSTTAKTVAKVVAQPAVDPGVSLGGDETVGRIGI